MDFDVSVVIRAQDSEDLLVEAARSALSQEGVAVEVALVDDCSQDGTARVAAELSLEDPERVRVVSHLEPQGRLESYRSGLRASHGPRVLLMDAEDRIAPGALARMVAAADEAQANALVASVAYVSDSPEPSSNDETGHQARVVSPLLQTIEGEDVAHALFRDRTVPATLKGRLFDTELARRALAEVERNRLADHDDAAGSFILATMTERMAVRPDIRSLDIAEARHEGPMPLEDFEAICANRATAEVVVDHLNRTEQWERFFADWEGLALMLCEEAVSRFPDGLAPEDLPRAADAMVEAWGAPYLAAAAADLGDRDLAQLAIGLGAAPGLAPKGSRPERLGILVRQGNDLADVLKVYDAVAGRRTSCVFITEQDVPLPETLTRIATLPAHQAVLARGRSLAHELEKAGVDGLILWEGPREGAYDELVARALRMPVALLAAGEHTSPAEYCDVAAQVALATNVIPANGVEGELWNLLGARSGSLRGLVSQMALGTTTRADTDSRTLASRLVATVREQDSRAQALQTSATEALDANERLEAENRSLRDRVADLERRLDNACAERDEFHAALDAEQNAGVLKRVFKRGKAEKTG
ncbi:glycosyltransferase family A protein [Olsenella sp. YH-ols2217]|uniref:Glycosyltransferase family A protein n=1 Tax=Kribbibacterium absianum TaxID=3044210 RepID=A0ABT6ZLZ2_9ACTN|nr:MULTISPECIES: glycosyltransferase family A protein [unclassified Olsenella]MDJ1122061.1 glycosyltransferase family A protein [Olsenella sp. YH-ols2216]MDJ1130069.1 glycosyltransferase family A protein [Olsenella sp. YH-ols2217]